MKWLFDQARKGQTIQRYKGLGGDESGAAMGDHDQPGIPAPHAGSRLKMPVAADDIFTTLMGDQVEPRREFIEKTPCR